MHVGHLRGLWKRSTIQTHPTFGVLVGHPTTRLWLDKIGLTFLKGPEKHWPRGFFKLLKLWLRQIICSPIIVFLLFKRNYCWYFIVTYRTTWDKPKGAKILYLYNKVYLSMCVKFFFSNESIQIFQNYII